MPAIVLLPLPETPITTMTAIFSLASAAFILVLRRGGAVDQPDQLAITAGASRRKFLAGKDARENVALLGAFDQKQHFAARCEGGKGQGDARHIGLHAGFGYADNPAGVFIEGRGAREQRSCMAVVAQAHQYKIKQRPCGVEPIGAVKAFQDRKS